MAEVLNELEHLNPWSYTKRLYAEFAKNIQETLLGYEDTACEEDPTCDKKRAAPYTTIMRNQLMTRTIKLTPSTSGSQGDQKDPLSTTVALPLSDAPLKPSSPPSKDPGQEVHPQTPFRKPRPGSGTLGFIGGDTCFFGSSLMGSCACKNAVALRLEERIPAAFNGFCGNYDQCSYWGILGDYFYDQSGSANRGFMNRLSDEVKKRTFIGTPGNHDIWTFGGPGTSTALSAAYTFTQVVSHQVGEYIHVLLQPKFDYISQEAN